jgi:hypothetical protein
MVRVMSRVVRVRDLDGLSTGVLTGVQGYHDIYMISQYISSWLVHTCISTLALMPCTRSARVSS